MNGLTCSLGVCIDNGDRIGNVICDLGEIASELRKFNLHMSPGPHECLLKILYKVGDEVDLRHCTIFNESLLTWEVPDDWKMVNVTSLSKKENCESPGNCESLNLTNTV